MLFLDVFGFFWIFVVGVADEICGCLCLFVFGFVYQ